MQCLPDLTCMDCNDAFKSAALLLQHFAKHAIKHLETETVFLKTDLINKKNNVPNLYPINRKSNIDTTEADRGSDSGVEDINPLKFCLVTMQENMHTREHGNIAHRTCMHRIIKKYQCTYCQKRFGWSTDLKRHILIHTGERPFHCQHCNSSFTRNFLLQKHQRKIHFSDNVKLPELKPISEIINMKNQKRQKFNIRHNSASLSECQNNYVRYKINSLVCSS